MKTPQTFSSDGSEPDVPYVNRDISWMYFNSRILKEAQRKDVPLLERVSFLGIYSNNLDEFFRVRMATVSRMAEMKGKRVSQDREEARQLFRQLSEINTRLSHEYERTVAEVTEELKRNGIRIVNETELDPDQQHFIRCLFREKISGFVSPVWLDKFGEIARENDSHIYLAVELRDDSRRTDHAIIELPTSQTGRFIALPDKDGVSHVMYLDDVIRFALPMIFPGMGFTRFRAYSFKFTKDAEMEIDNDQHFSPVEKIAKAVRNRKKGATLRVLYDKDMPVTLLQAIMKKLKLDKLDTVNPSGHYQNHKDFMSFPSSCRPDLKYPKWQPLIHPELKEGGSLMHGIVEKDRFIHVPYHSFDYLIRLLQEAAVSRDVKSIKITLYRLARHSKIVEALKNAARNGKKVTAVIELQARFDESSNIHYAKEMQEAGVNVVFGVEGLKIHSKIIHIGRKRGKDIAVVGTGNFHEGNARVYTDYFLMTARPDIVREVDQVFGVIKRPFEIPKFKSLIIPPFNMRARFLQLIDDEIAAARKGKTAWIKIKINHITDTEMVNKLYEASQAGVMIDLLVRGNNSLVPGVPGYSENIHITGIIDRYLEHSRIFIFHANGRESTFMGSADWLPRNLDRRIEVVAEVEDPDLKRDLRHTVETGLADTANAHLPGPDAGTPRHSGPDFRSQESLYNYYKNQL